mgnify:CR=1 FL=1
MRAALGGLARSAIATFLLLAALAAALAGCERPARPVPPLAEGGKLVVITTNGPVTWYEDAHGHATGFEHDLATAFAREIGVAIEFVRVASPGEAEKALEEGRGHLAAALLPRRFDLPGGMMWGPSYHSAQLQAIVRSADPDRPRGPADLANRRLAKIADGFTDPLPALPADLAARAEALPPGTPVEELLEDVAQGRYDVALVDSPRFTATRKHFPQLEAAFDVGKTVHYAWRVGVVDTKAIADRMKPFFARVVKDGTVKRLLERHFAHAARISAIDAGTLLERVNTVLPHLKPHFLEAERVSGFDWRLVAAIGYQESHWDPLATSPTGVRGLMMLTEDTAERLQVKDRLDPRESILGGARYLGVMADGLPPRIAEPDRTWLALAAYNLGIGHLEDARILAQRKGLSPDRWDDVKRALPGLADPAQYATLRHGFARGYEAMQFVDNVRNYQDILARVEPREGPLDPRPRPPLPEAAPKTAPPQGSTKAPVAESR